MKTKMVQTAAVVLCSLGGFAVVANGAGATTPTCTTKKVPVTKVVHVKVHGKTVVKHVDVRVSKRVLVAYKAKVNGKTVTKHKYVVKSVIKYKSVTSCIANAQPPVNGGTPSPVGTTAAPLAIKYGTSVDPTFVQSPSNPLSVTYSYDADATATQGIQTFDLASEGQLPTGILDMYADGMLVCSQNVGGTNGTPDNPDSCEVLYANTGQHTVITEYIPNDAQPVTETETDTIDPFVTSITTKKQNSTSIPPPVTTAPDGATCANGPGVGCIIISATIQGQGDASTPPVGTLTFGIQDNSGNVIGTLVPKVNGQTYCLVRWYSNGSPWTASATSPDCTGLASANYLILGFQFTATFAQNGYTSSSASN